MSKKAGKSGETRTPPQATIVIITYNRPRHVRRLLLLLTELKNPHPILILDGSGPEIQAQNRLLAQEFEGITLKQYPSELHLPLRLADGLRQVTTEYVVLCADDDFVLPDAVTKCVGFLGEHPAYSAVIGQVRAMGYSHRYFTKGIFVIDDLVSEYRLDGGSYIERHVGLQVHASQGCPPLFYAVRRTSHAVEAFDLMTDKMMHGTMETISDAMVLMRGYAIVLPFLFGFRDYASEATRDPLRNDPKEYVSTADIAHFRPVLAEKVREIEGVSPEIAEYVAKVVLQQGTPLTLLPQYKQYRPNRVHQAAWAKVRKKSQRLTKALASAYLPAITGKVLSIEPKIMKAIRVAQSALTR